MRFGENEIHSFLFIFVYYSFILQLGLIIYLFIHLFYFFSMVNSCCHVVTPRHRHLCKTCKDGLLVACIFLFHVFL